MKNHHYQTRIIWTGNQGAGTKSYAAYSRDHEIQSAGKAIIEAASDPAFRGNPERYNPEELLVASLSSCHMLWYLHLCAVNGIVVETYIDEAEGWMEETDEGGGFFKKVILKPRVTLSGFEKMELAESLHHRAHELCFIANSVNFEVACEPSFLSE